MIKICRKSILSMLCCMLFILFSSSFYSLESFAGNTGNVKKQVLGNDGTLKGLKTADFSPDMLRIIRRGKIVVGITREDMPPFFMTNRKGKLYGVDIELAQGIARALKVDIKYDRRAKNYQELFEMLAKGKIDMVLAKFSITTERSEVIRYTKPYMKLRFAVLLNKLYAAKHKLENYPMSYLKSAKVKIGVKAKTSYVEYGRKIFKNAKIVQYARWDDAVKALRKGKIEAAMYDENEAFKLINREPDSALYISVFVLKDKDTKLSIGVNWRDTQLLSWLNIYLDNEWKGKSVSDLVKEYPEVYENKTNKK